jgi:type IV secretion system protein VirB9
LNIHSLHGANSTLLYFNNHIHKDQESQPVKLYEIAILLLGGIGATTYAHASLPTSTESTDGMTRTVQYRNQDIVAIHARVNFTTLIVLPVGEEILDAAAGDKDFWIIDVVHNFVFIHPAKEGIQSNLNLITTKGNVYSFTLNDVSGTAAQTDLKVIIQPADRSSLINRSSLNPSASTAPVEYVPAQQVIEAKEAAVEAREVASQVVSSVKEQAVQAIDAYKAAYPTKLVMDYTFKKDSSPFFIDAIYHDDKFTYIKVGPKNQEKFAVYEMRDGKPDLITYDYKDGAYVVTHIMDSGYVRIGKKQMTFSRKQ